MNAAEILVLTNGALGLFTALARAYAREPDADQTLTRQLEALLPAVQTVADQVQAYQAIPKERSNG